jgi:trans-aconitate 2-methyltransferase
MSSAWDPDRYLRYADARLQPALDLIARISLERPELIVDLGCGTGHVTQVLQQRWPEAHLVGLDSSTQMLDKARQLTSEIEWQVGDIAAYAGASRLGESRIDLLFSNAALHWLEGHRALLARLMALLSPGGVLAVQMPLSYDLPSHTAMRELLAQLHDDGEPIGDDELRAQMSRRPVQSPEFYYRVLRPLCSELSIWSTEYLQVLEGEDPVLDFVSSTGLRPVLRQLPTQRRDVFLERYREALRELYRTEADGRVLFPFRRLFLIARSG